MGFIYGALRMANDYLSTAAKISVRADANDTIVAAVTKARREELEIAQDRFSAAVHMVAFFRQNWKCVPTPLERKFLQGKGGKNIPGGQTCQRVEGDPEGLARSLRCRDYRGDGGSRVDP